jgi:hypothetical protein
LVALHVGAVFAGIEAENAPAGLEVMLQVSPTPALSPLTVHDSCAGAFLRTLLCAALNIMDGGISVQVPPTIEKPALQVLHNGGSALGSAQVVMSVHTPPILLYPGLHIVQAGGLVWPPEQVGGAVAVTVTDAL